MDRYGDEMGVTTWQPYRRAFALPGAPAFVCAGFVARLPMSMIPLGIVLAVSGLTGTYGLAGALSATFAVSAAIGSPLTSRIIDRRGQHRVLPLLAFAHGIALTGLVVALEAQWPLIAQFACAALAGALVPAIGAFVRARWATQVHAQPPGTRSPVTLSSAFAIESILDELVYTIGPLLAATLATSVGATLPLVVAVGLGLAGALALSTQRRTEPPPRAPGVPSAGGEPRRRLLGLPGMPRVMVTLLAIGLVFGAYEVSVVASCQQADAPTATGIVLAVWAIGSMIAGAWFGSRHWQVPIARQLFVTTGLVALTVVPALIMPSIIGLAIVTMVAGAAFAPSLICLFALTEQSVPAARLTEGLAWCQSAIAIGFAAGAALGGLGIDAWGPQASFAIPLAAGLAAWAPWVGPGLIRQPVR